MRTENKMRTNKWIIISCYAIYYFTQCTLHKRNQKIVSYAMSIQGLPFMNKARITE